MPQIVSLPPAESERYGVRPDGAAAPLGLKPGNLDAVAGKKGGGNEARKDTVRDSTQGERDAAWLSVAQQLQREGGRDNPRLTKAVRALCTISDDVDFMPSMIAPPSLAWQSTMLLLLSSTTAWSFT